MFNSKVPGLLFFTGHWRGPCRQVAPVIKQVTQDCAGRLNVVSVNADEAPEMRVQYDCKSLPAFKIFIQDRIILEFWGALEPIDRDTSKAKSKMCAMLDPEQAP